ncbi:septal ring lytic transglycosylase RlpA family protein [Helicobacter cetorum]|uniref:Probable endolytic peptidoglycan transglycosylase RlpA n=1 Tax=Helicobacter cetorum (strain ATCC BAA-540 / CCUG 52418 / MIT 99-5656) TaxID=1163745 RepID=I0ES41_HELCM|nr:septal ring lytic transglycosylase RlpA family protein [Helicobacter cetorum]AFI05760.1 rare lipoprotein A [Helicobacter cetorum MIT 99-5656]
MYLALKICFLSLMLFISACATKKENVATKNLSYKHESLRAYENAKDYDPKTKTATYKRNFFERHFKHQKTPQEAPQNSGTTNQTLDNGMRDSSAIQRATMRPYQVGGKWYYPTKVDLGETFDGVASWYGPNFHAKKTSNGEIYNMYAHTAAHKTLPMNTIVKVINKENNLSTIVRINDRGPFVNNRIIDLSNVAARDIDMVKKGTANVRLVILGFGGVISKQYEQTFNAHSSKTLQKEFKIGESQKSVSGGRFSLQMGAFRNQLGARTLADKLEKQSKNYSVKVVLKNDLYKVLVQGFQSEEEARDFMKNHNQNAILIRE